MKSKTGIQKSKRWFILFFFFSQLIFAQTLELWGLTHVAGTNPKGIIYKVNSNGTGYTIVDTLSGLKGGDMPGSLMRARNGTLYGMTLNGGANGFGIIFCYDVFNSVFTKIIDFGSTNGKQPFGSLTEASDGMLYGMTQAGGNFNKGVIFKVDPSNNTFTKLYNFSLISGSIPVGNLMEASNGLLYGMTSSGGTSGYGTVFSFDPADSTFIKLHNFNGTDGKSPLGSLVQASNGKLYGMTYLGGAYTKGVIFNIDISNNNFTVIYTFNNSSGQNPLASLVLASNGKLYGMMPNGGTQNSGVIFSINVSNDFYTKEYDFIGGASPNGSLMEASDGNLYATTEAGGSNFLGTIFSFNPTTKTFTKIVDFSSSTYGYNPTGDVIEVKPVKVIVPNVFSPNGDNINEEFFIITSGVTTLYCEIFNRWGQKVFTLRDSTDKWDGKWDGGKEATDGIYYYTLTANTYDKKSHVLRGFVLVIK